MSIGRESQPPDLLATLRADLGVTTSREFINLVTVRSLATVLFRLAQSMAGVSPLLAYFIKQINHLLTGADLAWQAQVGPGLRLYHPTGVVIGPDVTIGADCAIQQGVTLGAARERGSVINGRIDSPTLGDGVILGAGSRIIGPVVLGDRAVVGANAVVVHDVPSDHLALGVPATVRSREASR